MPAMTFYLSELDKATGSTERHPSGAGVAISSLHKNNLNLPLKVRHILPMMYTEVRW
jgi:hypothetical protein